MMKRIWYKLFKARALLLPRRPPDPQSTMPKYYLVLQFAIICSTLLMAVFLLGSNLERGDFMGHSGKCEFTFGPLPKPLNFTREPYSCPRSGLRLVDHDMNVVFVKYGRIVNKYGLQCYYKENGSSVWMKIRYPTPVHNLLVHARCFQGRTIVFEDLLPLVPASISLTNYVRLLRPTSNNNEMKYLAPRWKPRTRLEAPNVLVVTLRGVSRNAFLRYMPKTRGFLERDRSGILFHNFLAKSQYSSDSYTALFRNCNRFLRPRCGYRDYYLWQHFKRHGYYTVHLEDSLHAPVMQDRFPNIDYEWRNLQGIEEFGTHWLNGKAYCLKDRRYHDILFRQVLQFGRTKKQLFAWIGINFAMSNDVHLQSLDDSFMVFLMGLEAYGLLDRFVVLVVSDQGRQHGENADILPYYNERFNPIGLVRFPQWFNRTHGVFMSQLYRNKANMISHNFLYEMVRSLLHLGNHTHLEDYVTRPKKSGKFECPGEFPAELCPCEHTIVKHTSTFLERLVDFALREVNMRLRRRASQCGTLQRAAITSARYCDSLSVFKARVSVHVNGVFKDAEVFEAYVQVRHRRPIGWKLERLTYTLEALRKPCLRRVPNALKPYCFC